MTAPALGIDISKLKFNVCLINASSTRRHKVFQHTEAGFAHLLAWRAKQGLAQVHACLEATGTYSEPRALCLVAAGQIVSLINPAAIKALAASRPLAHEDRPRGRRTDRPLLPRASATSMDTARA